jgi:hypothetical protein
MLIALAVVTIVLLAGSFYVTYLLSWCAGYDAAVSGSARGSLLWRHLTVSSTTSGDAQKGSGPALQSYQDIRRAVDAVSSSVWAEQNKPKPEVVDSAG